MPENRDWIEIHEVSDQIQANILKGLLEAQGVTVNISQEGYQQAIGLSGLPGMMVKLYVPDDQVQQAQQVLNDFYAGNYEEDND